MALAEDERVIKNQLNVYLGNLAISLAKPEPIPAPRKRQIEGDLTRGREALNDLELAVSKRISKIKDDAEAAVQRNFFSTLYVELEENLVGKQIDFEKATKDGDNSHEKLTDASQEVTNAKAALEELHGHFKEQLQIDQANHRVSYNRQKFHNEAVEMLKQELETKVVPAYNALILLDKQHAAEHKKDLEKLIRTETKARLEMRANISQLPVGTDARLTSTANNSVVGDQEAGQNAGVVPGAGGLPVPNPLNFSNWSFGNSFNNTKLHHYKPDDLPVFSGKVEDYFEFKEEFQTVVAPGRPLAWVLKKLNKLTPEAVDLSAKETIDEAWEELDCRYGNPLLVADKVMNKFMHNTQLNGNDDQKMVQLEGVLTKLHNSLKQYKCADQLTHNICAINSIIKMIPNVFLRDLTTLREQHVHTPGASHAYELWVLVYEFVLRTKKVIYQFRPHSLENMPKATTRKSNYCQSCLHCGQDDPDAGHGGAPDAQLNALTADQLKEKMEAYHKMVGPCPACKGNHTWKRGNIELASGRLEDCPVWKAKPVADKVKILKDAGGCAQCTHWKHAAKDCKMKKPLCGQGGCKKKHHKSLHGSKEAFVTSVNKVSVSKCDKVPCPGTPTLLHLTEMTFGNVKVTVFLDDGSTSSLITHTLAKQLQLPFRDVKEWIEVAGKEAEPHITKLYSMKWRNKDGTLRTISLLGMDRIASVQNPHSMDWAYDIFPHVPKGALTRPSKPVGILLGQDQADLLAHGGDGPNRVGKLRAMNIDFASGWVLGGTHEHVVKDEFELTASAHLMRTAKFVNHKLNHISRAPRPPIGHTCCSMNHDFLEGEAIAINLPKRCKKCSNCPSCTFQDNQKTIKEQHELELLKANIKLHPEGFIQVSYPWIIDLKIFKDNREQAIKRAMSNFASLTKRGLVDAYHEQIQEYVTRGVLKKVTEAEIEAWKAGGGVVHYVSHHGVLNDHSKSTPLRVVVDSKMKNCYDGPSLNDATVKGINALNDLFQVLVRWRSYEVALVWDLSKAYHQMKTGPVEFFMRLVVWKFGPDGEMETFGHTCVGFGDKPASNCLEVSKDKIAEAGADIDPEASEKIISDTYVDDGDTGGSHESVDRMMGTLMAASPTMAQSVKSWPWEASSPRSSSSLVKVTPKF